jgi:hypothetical protein
MIERCDVDRIFSRHMAALKRGHHWSCVSIKSDHMGNMSYCFWSGDVDPGVCPLCGSDSISEIAITSHLAKAFAIKVRCNTILENLLFDADRICAIIDIMIHKGLLDARSELADERLCYGEPLPFEVAKALLYESEI